MYSRAPKNSPKAAPNTIAEMPAVRKMFPHCLRFPVPRCLIRRANSVRMIPCPRSPNIIPKKMGNTNETMGVGSTSWRPGVPCCPVTSWKLLSPGGFLSRVGTAPPLSGDCAGSTCTIHLPKSSLNSSSLLAGMYPEIVAIRARSPETLASSSMSLATSVSSLAVRSVVAWRFLSSSILASMADLSLLAAS